jgi:hypothetical protein
MAAPGAAPVIRRPRKPFFAVLAKDIYLASDLETLAAPLNLANSPSLHLLTAPEQTLCSQLRILPKPYLVIKETLVREYARRGGKLRRREARDLVKIDVNKTARVWDFLVQAGYLKITNDSTAAPPLDSRYGTLLYFFLLGLVLLLCFLQYFRRSVCRHARRQRLPPQRCTSIEATSHVNKCFRQS